MPPTLADRLVHILTAIDAIQTMLARKTREDFAADCPLRLAVERALEIICEASRRIPKKYQSSTEGNRLAAHG
jgi:uncharacterized protein with HEPN domain